MLQFVADLVSREDGRQRTEDGTKRNRVHPNIAVPPQESPQGLHLLEHSGDEDPGHHAEHPLLRGNTNIKPPGSRGNASFKRTCPDQHSIFFFFWGWTSLNIYVWFVDRTGCREGWWARGISPEYFTSWKGGLCTSAETTWWTLRRLGRLLSGTASSLSRKLDWEMLRPSDAKMVLPRIYAKAAAFFLFFSGTRRRSVW